jgi:hypothetical protein
MTSDDHTAGSGLFTLLDEVCVFDTLFGVCLSQFIGEIVVSNASGVHHRSRWKNILKLTS